MKRKKTLEEITEYTTVCVFDVKMCDLVVTAMVLCVSACVDNVDALSVAKIYTGILNPSLRVYKRFYVCVCVLLYFYIYEHQLDVHSREDFGFVDETCRK